MVQVCPLRTLSPDYAMADNQDLEWWQWLRSEGKEFQEFSLFNYEVPCVELTLASVFRERAS